MTDRPEGFFFIHIPKTAGTSFRRMLYDEFPGDAIYPTHDEIVANGGNYPAQGTLARVDPSRRTRARVLVGHYPIAAGKSFFGSQQFSSMTFVREPVERAISNLLHLQRHAPQLRGLDPHQIIDEAPHQLSNLQVRFLSSIPGPLTDDHLQQAKENLAQLSYFGITERFSESIERARSHLGWTLADEIETNIRPSDSPIQSDEVIERLRAANEMDQELYDHACRLFDGPSVTRAVSDDAPSSQRLTKSQRVTATRRQRFFERWLGADAHGLVIATQDAPPVTASPGAETWHVGPDDVDQWSWPQSDARFGYIVADAVLEIMPDPITWLQGLERSMSPEGSALLVHPNLQTTGQPTRPLSTVGAAVQAHLDQDTSVSLASRFDSSFYATGGPGPRTSLNKATEPPETHATVTVFSPTSLRTFIDTTRRMGYHQLIIKRMFQREDQPSEFLTLLVRKSNAANS